MAVGAVESRAGDASPHLAEVTEAPSPPLTSNETPRPDNFDASALGASFLGIGFDVSIPLILTMPYTVA